MIGKLTGLLDCINEDSIILDVNGVGYEVNCSIKTISELQSIDDKVILWIDTIVKEDSIALYGFFTKVEQKWFRELCKISGVGMKMAIRILSALSPSELLNAIHAEDVTMLTQAQGVGKKLAVRIITEMKNTVIKMEKSGDEMLRLSGDDATGHTTASMAENAILNDALLALEGLGYGRGDAYRVCITKIQEKNDITLESLITEALKSFSQL